MREPLVSLITLNYNRKFLVEETLRSLVGQAYSNTEIIMVDNASTDGSVIYIKGKFPDIKILRTQKNIGPAAYSLGLKSAKGKYLMTIDDDVVIKKNIVEEIVEIFNSCPVDIIAFRILDHKTKKPIDNPGHSINGNDECGYQTAFLNGAVVPMRREVFQKVGFYSKKYFAYAVELDFCMKALRAGFKIKYFPKLTCLHKFGPSKTRLVGKYYVARNWIYFLAEYIPWWAIPIFLIWTLFGFFYSTAKGYGTPGSYSKGLVDSFKAVPYYLKKRKPLNLEQLILFSKTQFMFGGFTNKW